MGCGNVNGRFRKANQMSNPTGRFVVPSTNAMKGLAKQGKKVTGGR